MSCSSCSSGSLGGISVGGGEAVTELLKVNGIDEANKLLAKGCLFVSMYFNQASQQEVYILGHLKTPQTTKKPIGFMAKN